MMNKHDFIVKIGKKAQQEVSEDLNRSTGDRYGHALLTSCMLFVFMVVMMNGLQLHRQHGHWIGEIIEYFTNLLTIGLWGYILNSLVVPNSITQMMDTILFTLMLTYISSFLIAWWTKNSSYQ